MLDPLGDLARLSMLMGNRARFPENKASLWHAGTLWACTWESLTHFTILNPKPSQRDLT